MREAAPLVWDLALICDTMGPCRHRRPFAFVSAEMPDNLAKAVRAFVAKGAGLATSRVVRARQKPPGSRPALPFATVRQVAEITQGKTPSTTLRGTTGTVYADQRLLLRRHYLVEFQGPGGHELAKAARAFIASIDAGGSASSRGKGVSWPSGRAWPSFAVVDIGVVEDASVEVSDGWEERWDFQFVIEFSEDRRYDLGRIDTVPRTTRRE